MRAIALGDKFAAGAERAMRETSRLPSSTPVRRVACVATGAITNGGLGLRSFRKNFRRVEPRRRVGESSTDNPSRELTHAVDPSA